MQLEVTMVGKRLEPDKSTGRLRHAATAASDSSQSRRRHTCVPRVSAYTATPNYTLLPDIKTQCDKSANKLEHSRYGRSRLFVFESFHSQ